MDIILLLIAVISLVGIHFQPNDYNKDYLSLDRTTSIKGIFVMLVFLSHFKGYFIDPEMSKMTIITLMCLGQAIVIPFFFYSGYGVMLGMKERGEAYAKKFFWRRFVKTWMLLALALLLYVLEHILCHYHIGVYEYFMATTGWSSIGNSSWFMLAILSAYGITSIAIIVGFPSYKKILIIVAVLCIIYMVIVSRYKSYYYYDTIAAYPFGMLWALYKDDIEKTLQNRSKRFYGIFLLSACIFVVVLAWRTWLHQIPSFILWSCGFSFLLVMLTMKVKIGNPVLSFLGKHVFEIYIFQRIPMNYMDIFSVNMYIKWGFCVIVTLVIAVIFSKITKLLFYFVGKFTGQRS